MKLAAAKALADFIPEEELSADNIIPPAFAKGVGKAVARRLQRLRLRREQRASKENDL